MVSAHVSAAHVSPHVTAAHVSEPVASTAHVSESVTTTHTTSAEVESSVRSPVSQTTSPSRVIYTHTSGTNASCRDYVKTYDQLAATAEQKVAYANCLEDHPGVGGGGVVAFMLLALAVVAFFVGLLRGIDCWGRMNRSSTLMMSGSVIVALGCGGYLLY